MCQNETLRYHVREAFKLSTILWEAQSVALAETQALCKRFDHFIYPSIRPMMIRPCFREALQEAALPDGWILGGDTTKTVEIYLMNEAEGIRLRYLKERRATYPGGVPPAGRNPRRQAYWTMPKLFDVDDSTVLPLQTNLLLLWDYLDSAHIEKGFTLRIVHTIAPGNWGQRTPIDLSIDIPGIPGLETVLEFEDYPEDTLFFADLSEEATSDATLA